MKKINLVKKFTVLSIMGAGMAISLVSSSQVKAYCYPNLESCLRKQNDLELGQEMKTFIGTVDFPYSLSIFSTDSEQTLTLNQFIADQVPSW
jgi:hypothetical protein